MDRKKTYSKLCIDLLVLLVVIIFFVFVLPKAVVFFLPFVIGWLIAMIANPLVKYLERKLNIIRKWSSAIIIIVVLTVIIGVIYLLGSALVKQSIQLVKDFPKLSAEVEQTIDRLVIHNKTIRNIVPEQAIITIREFFANLDENLMAYVEHMDTPSLSSATNIVKSVADAFFLVIITILSSYFFIAEKDLLVERMKKALPQYVLFHYNLIADNFKIAIGGYIKAQLKIMVIIVAILFLGFKIVGVEYSFLIAFLIGVLDFLPVFGTGAVIWPWAVFDVITGNLGRAIVLMVLYLVCQIVKQMLQPKMVGDSIGLSPLATLFFLFIGYKIKGVLGILIGIPVGMILVNLYRIGTFNSIIDGCKLVAQDINRYRKEQDESK